MNKRPPKDLRILEAWSLDDFCRDLRLSKRRVHELQKRGVLPKARSYCVRSRRPLFYLEDMYAALEVRQRNVGINGEIVSFNTPRAKHRAGETGRA